jgi:hypothetical protein
MNRNQLIKKLRAKGIVEVNGKKLTKCKGKPLQDYWDANFVIETKNVSEEAIEIVPESKPISLEKNPVVDIKELMQAAKESAKEIKYTSWQKRIISLVSSEQHKVEDEKWVIPMSDLKAILQLPIGKGGKEASAYRYSCDWKVSSKMSAGIAICQLGYEASLSLAKGKEKLTIKKMSSEKQAAQLLQYKIKPLV